ncbi:MAG: nuclear transport factor 2 family protein [Phycisphaerales bacterium]|nr:nuclear transport factor 2 family protein [Phycisphaerales bacterium]
MNKAPILLVTVAAAAALGLHSSLATALPPSDAAQAAPTASPRPPEVQVEAKAPAAAWPEGQKGLDALAAKLVMDWMTTAGSGDAAAIESALAPCFQRISFAGAFDRSGEAAQLKTMAPKDAKFSGIVATRAGDALVVTCLMSVTETVAGKAAQSDEQPRLGVWTIVDGSWKLVAWATFNMPSPRPAPGAPGFAGDAALNAEGESMLKRFLSAQHAKDMPTFEAMVADGMQVINFKGQKTGADIVKGASHATTDAPTMDGTRATRCGDLTIVTCSLTMGQKVGWSTLPADPAPFLAVFRGTGDGATVIALANTNRPK